MKIKYSIVIFFMVFVSALVHADHGDEVFGKAFFAQRSQWDNLARRIVGEQYLLIGCDSTAWLRGVGSLAVEYGRSFNPDGLGKYFAFNGTDIMRFAGDQATPPEDVAKRDVRAEYFGLSSDFDGTVKFAPQVTSTTFDPYIRFNLNSLLCGLYLDVDLPITKTHFGMNLEQHTDDPGTGIDFDIGGENICNAFSYSIIQAYKGFNGTTGGPDCGVELTFQNLLAARIDGTQNRSATLGVELALGWNFLCSDCAHMGVSLVYAPARGTKPVGEFVFEPVIGNANHSKVGAGLSGHYVLWQDDCRAQSFSFWVEAQVAHLMTAQQRRTFDLKKNGIGSRYIQLKQFDANNIFTGTLIPAANVTTMDADVSVSALGEGFIMFDYRRCDFLFDVGYGLWGRSKETIKLKGSVPPLLGVAGSIDGPTLNRTKSDATIKTGGTADATNVYLTLADIDPESAASPSAFSQKIFVNVSYTWDVCGYAPFAGLGGETEFSLRANRALSQWGIWIKGGVGF